MDLLMCRSCGEFVAATWIDGEILPRVDACPDCGAGEFKHNETDTIVTVDD